MNATIQGSPSARTRRIAVPPTGTTVPYRRSAEFTRACSLAAAIVGPQGNAIPVVLRTMVARVTFARVR